jgi:hypothetical protein
MATDGTEVGKTNEEGGPSAGEDERGGRGVDEASPLSSAAA